MTELLTAAQMRAIERAAIESGEVTGLELMERAGRGTVEAILAEWPELASGARRAVVLCGPGNNGGDGFVVARLLRERGWGVEVFLYGDFERLPPDARVNWGRWLEMGEIDAIPPRPGGRWDGGYWHHHGLDVVVDAIFGIGLKRPVETPLKEFFSALNRYEFAVGGPRTVALDVPSGLQSDTGRVLGNLIAPELTVAYHAEKVGHRVSDGPRVCRRVRVVDIGITFAAEFSLTRPTLAELADDPRVMMLEPVGWTLRRTRDDDPPPSPGPILPVLLLTEEDRGPIGHKNTGHKYDHGHALVLSGGVGRGGAARMAARGALRIGAGLVTLACPPSALLENASRVDAIMTRAVRGAEGLAEMLSDERINAVALGPGIGTGDETAALVRAALTASGSGRTEAERDRRVVLDADALTLLARDPDLFALLHDRCVLTPHAGEFARLFPDIAERLDAPAETGPAHSKVDATRDAAARAGCVVLLKGPDTVIAHPDGRAAINSAHYERSAPWLATAGAGDVLTGFVAGLLARGLEPMQAAEAAAWLHVECALEFGPGLIAEDLPEQLPAVFRRLL